MSDEVQEAREYLAVSPAEATVADVVVHHRKSYQTTLSEGISVVESKDPKAKAEIQLLAQEILAVKDQVK